MVVKLGDLLLKEKVITPAQLEEALNYQVIFGGKLGTNLIEMGVPEETVTAALSRKFGIRAADPDQVMNAPGEVIETVPIDIAKKFRVIPIELKGRRLTLAMTNPTDLKAIDEISFRTGLIVQPVVITDVRLAHALEKHYDVGRERRYIHVAKRIELEKETPAPPPSRPAQPFEEEAEEEFFELPPDPPAPAPTPAAEPARQGAGEVIEAAEIIDLEGDVIEEEAPAAPPVQTLTEQTFSARLVEARDRDDILDAFIGHLSRTFPRCAIFLVRGEMAMGWRCASDRELVTGFDQLQIPLDEPSVLRTVIESRSYYLGPLPRSPFNSMMIQSLGGSVPETALLVPLSIAGRIVGILYVDGKGLKLGEHLFDLQKLTAGAAMAFEILVLKNKILSL